MDAGDDNGTDLQLDSTAGLMTTLTGNAFAGNTFFIDNQSTQNLNVTAGTGNTFDESNNFRIEDKMHHRVDDLTKGLITWVANNVWITQSGGGSTDSSIQRGVNALLGGHVVNVEGGANPYVEAVTIDRAVTIDGEGSGYPHGRDAATVGRRQHHHCHDNNADRRCHDPRHRV